MRLKILHKRRAHTTTPTASVFINSHRQDIRRGESWQGIVQTELRSLETYYTHAVRGWNNLRAGELLPREFNAHAGYPRNCPELNRHEPSRIAFISLPDYPLLMGQSRHKRTIISAPSGLIPIYLPYHDPKRPFIRHAWYRCRMVAIASFAYANAEHAPLLGIGVVLPSFSWDRRQFIGW